MKKVQISLAAIALVVTVAFSSFTTKTLEDTLYWFQPSSQNYIIANTVTAEKTRTGFDTTTPGTLREEGFTQAHLITQSPVNPNDGHQSVAADASLYSH